jgi:uncharacterized protein (UPF0335 family)
MRRKKAADEDVAPAQPVSITELEPVVNEFVEKLKRIEHEEETLREMKKELVEEYADKLDTKMLKLALRVSAIKEKAEHKDTFDTFCEILERA